MSQCNSCRPGRSCHDFSSRAAQLPSLAAIDVVEGLLAQAVRNTVRRLAEVWEGTMSPEEAADADQRLCDWLTATFCGENRHYACVEGWNPEGLANYVREQYGDQIPVIPTGRRRGDEGVIESVMVVLVGKLHRMIEEELEAGAALMEVPVRQAAQNFTTSWAALLVGAPFDEPQD